jgi:hypothetical protein
VFDWLARLFGRSEAPDAQVRRITDEVMPFLHAAKMSVDQHDLMIPRKHALIYCFALGSVEAASSGNDLDETSRLAVIVQAMQRLSNFSPHEGSGLLGQVMSLLEEEEGQRARATGREHYRRWREGDRRAANILADYLRNVPEPG